MVFTMANFCQFKGQQCDKKNNLRNFLSYLKYILLIVYNKL